MGVFISSLTTPSALAAFFSTAVISLAPNLLLLFLPDVAVTSSSSPMRGAAVWLTMGQAMAAGGLLGDVFLHTLGSFSDEDPTTTGLWILGGYGVFLMVDLMIRALGEDGEDKAKCHSRDEKTTPTTFNSMILLNIAADVLHNFTDGLAIGASYSTIGHRSFMDALASRGGVATLSVLFHEVPHEIGDYCTLVKNGYSRRHAVAIQFGTGVGALLGTLAAVLASTQPWAEERLSWLTAGGFIYLASSTLLPEVLNEGGEGSHWKRIMFRLAQMAAFCLGVFSLYAVAILESSGMDSHSHHHHGRVDHHLDHHFDHHQHEHHGHDDHHSHSHKEL